MLVFGQREETGVPAENPQGEHANGTQKGTRKVQESNQAPSYSEATISEQGLKIKHHQLTNQLPPAFKVDLPSVEF